GGASGAVHERILARLVEIEAVMSVLERRDPQRPGSQARNELGDQGRFAGAAPAGEADDTHAAYIGRFALREQSPELPATQPGTGHVLAHNGGQGAASATGCYPRKLCANPDNP